MERHNYWKNDYNKKRRVLVTVGDFDLNYEKSVNLPSGWKPEKMVIVKEPYPSNPEKFHLHYCIVLENAIAKSAMYPDWWQMFPDKNIDVQVKYKSDDYLLAYAIEPDKEKILDEQPLCYNTTVEEVKMRYLDMKCKRTKGSVEQLRELQEGILNGLDYKELQMLNNTCARLFMQGKLSSVIKEIERGQDPDNLIPNRDDWIRDDYQDIYDKAWITEYLVKQKELYRHKHKQLYIVGPPDTYKTTTLMAIAAENRWRVFEAPASMREWEKFDEKVYDLILWDEFDPEQIKYNRKRLLDLMGGQSTTLDIKCKGPETFNLRKNKVPVVFMSNENPPNDPAFLSRIEEVREKSKGKKRWINGELIA